MGADFMWTVLDHAYPPALQPADRPAAASGLATN
jgi:hypothetical protein